MALCWTKSHQNHCQMNNAGEADDWIELTMQQQCHWYFRGLMVWWVDVKQNTFTLNRRNIMGFAASINCFLGDGQFEQGANHLPFQAFIGGRASAYIMRLVLTLLPLLKSILVCWWPEGFIVADTQWLWALPWPIHLRPELSILKANRFGYSRTQPVNP